MVTRCPPNYPDSSISLLCDYVDGPAHRIEDAEIWYKNAYCLQCWHDQDDYMLTKVIDKHPKNSFMEREIDKKLVYCFVPQLNLLVKLFAYSDR